MSTTAETPSPALDRRFVAFNATVSTVALALLAYLLLLRSPTGGGTDLRFMPAVNAALNSTAAILLVSGYVAIRRKRPDIHKYFMVGAFAASALFLVGYVAYHYMHGDTSYPPGAPLRGLYLGILASHVLLSMTVVPLSLTTFYLAYRRRFATHRKVARWTLPIWLYVSVTGVVIFFMLRAVT